jgi:hypothetical protein
MMVEKYASVILLCMVFACHAGCRQEAAPLAAEELTDGLVEIRFRYRHNIDLEEPWEVSSRRSEDLEAFTEAITDPDLSWEYEEGVFDLAQELWLDLTFEDGSTKTLVGMPWRLDSWFYEVRKGEIATVTIEGKPLENFVNRFIVSRNDSVVPRASDDT